MHFSLPLKNSCRPMPAIHVMGVGNVEFPITSENTGKLLAVAEPTPFAATSCRKGKNTSINSSWQIERACISFPETSRFLVQNLPKWIKLVLIEHEIDVQWVEANCSLTRLVMYHSDSHYIRHRYIKQEIGHFGTIMVQLPVEKKYLDAEMKISQANETNPNLTITKDLSLCNDPSFCVKFFSANCESVIEPKSTGWNIELAYNLMWKPEKATLAFPNLLSFLVTLTKMTLELRSWQENVSENCRPKIMIIGLDRKYKPSRHSFSTLMGSDRQVAFLMCSVPFMDVYLARLTRRITRIAFRGYQDAKADDVIQQSSTTKRNLDGNVVEMKEMQYVTHFASHWVGVDDCVTEFYNLDIDKEAQMVKPLFENRTPDKVQRKNNKSKETILIHDFYQTVLILWPRQGSLYMNIHHRPDYVLNQLERGTTHNPLKTLRAIIAHSEFMETRIFRLLSLCLSLNARKEALQLLEVMASKSIGVLSDYAAVLISDVACKLIGWIDCENVINKLLACNTYKHLSHFLTIGRALLCHNCTIGFSSVSNQIWNFLMERIHSSDISNSPNALSLCIEMGICMEHSSVAIQSRSEQFFTCFMTLPLLQQCHIIIDLKEIYMKNAAGNKFYLSLCSYVAITVTSCSVSIIDCVVDLLRCFLLLEPQPVNIAEIFLENICRSQRDGCENNQLLEKLVASLHTLNMTSQMAMHLLDCRIVELSSLRKPKFSWSMEEAKFPDAVKYPTIVEFLQSSKKSLTLELDQLNKISEARDFIRVSFGVMDDCVRRGYSAVAVPTKNGRNIFCDIKKTRHLYTFLTVQFNAKMDELKRLKQLRPIVCCSSPNVQQPPNATRQRTNVVVASGMKSKKAKMEKDRK
ncbi:uncharacterized protein LOC130686170 [Daphnia carinata]|uniref:uncharacterized protein LOC130686170 n=1 Tax=Daphnia carinata TaxID=120202 RepID=UPI002579F1ED|nr:uncharacterized protein LOC130686170 [Daphnia carinata]